MATPTPAAGDGMWSITAVAEHLDVSPEVVRRWISRGELRAYKYGPKLIRIDPADVRRMGRPIGAPRWQGSLPPAAPAAPAAPSPAPPAARRAPVPARSAAPAPAKLPAYATPAPRGVPRAIGGGAR